MHLNKNLNVAQILLHIAGKKKTRFLQMKTWDGDTPLHIAVFSNDIEMIKFLLNSTGENSENMYNLLIMQNTHEWTSLHEAVHYNHITIVKFLLNVAGDKVQELIMIKNKWKKTALDLAHSTEAKDIMQEYLTNNKQI